LKNIKAKTLILTSIVCLLGIVPGLVMWKLLPDNMAIHFDINNIPDNFAPKWFVVFVIPLIMFVFQIGCCIVTDMNQKKYPVSLAVERTTKWIIPFVTITLQLVTIAYSIGVFTAIHRAVCIIVGVMLITTGCSIRTLGYVKNFDVDSEKAKRINRFVGSGIAVVGIAFALCAFLPSVTLVFCIGFLVSFSIISVVYAMRIKKE